MASRRSLTRVRGRLPSFLNRNWSVLLLPGLLCFSATTLEGQVAGAAGLSLALEGRFIRQADDLVSPLRYSGTAWGVGVRFDESGPTRLLRASLSFGLPTLRSHASGGGAHREEGYRADLGLGLFRQVASLRGGAFSLLVGGEVRGEFAYYDHWYTAVDGESWLHLFALVQPGGAWRLRLPMGGELRQSVTLPVGGVVFRPDYQGMTESPDPVLVGWGKVKGLHHKLEFLVPMGGRGWWGVSYGFTALRYPDPRPFAMTRHTLSVQATIWGGSG